VKGSTLLKSQLKAGAVLSFVALFLNSAISILYTPIMLKLIGPSEYGLYSLATSTVGFVGVLNFGLGNALIRYTAKYKVLKDEEGCSRLYGMFFLMYGVLGAIALIVGIILTLNSHTAFSHSLSLNEVQKLKYLMGILTLNISTGIGFGIFSVIILAQEKFIFQKMIGILNSIVNPIIMLPLLLMGHDSVSIVIVATVLNFITILINMYYCFKVLKIKIIFDKFEIKLFKEITVFSFFIFLNLIIDKIYWSTDQIILGIYSGTLAVSIYSIGASFSGYFSGFAASISNVFLSKITGMVTKEVSDEELSDLFIRIGRIQYIVISFALSGFIVFGQEFINLWVGENYSKSFYIALLIVVPMIISLIQSIGGVILQAKNMQKFKTTVNFVIAIGNVLLSIIFVQWWGAIGCAIATAIAYTIGNIIIMNIYYWKKIHINIPRFWKNILLMSVPFIASLAIGVKINNLILTNTWFVLFIKISVFSVVYILLMWYIGMNKLEKELFIVPIKRILTFFRKKNVLNRAS